MVRLTPVSTLGFASVLWVLLGAGSAHASALLEVDGDLHAAASVHAQVDIESQVATTVAEIVFDVSGTSGGRFLFPTPEAASVVGFAQRVGNDWVDATISREDPRTADDVAGDRGGDQAIRDHLGSNAFVVRVAPNGSDQVRVRLTYIEILRYDFGEVSYTLPLAGYAQLRSTTRYRVDLALHTARSLTSAGAPGFDSGMRVVDSDTTHRSLRFDGVTNGRDFRFVYSVLQRDDLFTHLLTHHDRCDEDGFFLLVVEPKQDVEEQDIVPKYFTFVVDTSGSMDGRKIEQAKQAAAFSIRQLNRRDRFNVVTFSDRVESVFGSPREVSDDSVREALGFVEERWASGGTNIDGALKFAFSARADTDFARIVVLLTDGEPTAGETDPEAILANQRRANTSDARLFTFGIGADVNASLLRALAADHRGEMTLFQDGAPVQDLLADFFVRIDRPVMTDARLDLGDIEVYDHHPETTTDLFAGTQLFVVGRYREGGQSTATLRGNIKGDDVRYTFDVDFPGCARGANGFLPRLWAKAKIESLLDRIAREGEDPRLVAEIEALATRYGIQTEYTSFGVSSGAPRDDPPPPSSGRQPAGSSSSGGGSSGGGRRSPGRYSGGALEDGEGGGCSSTPGGGGGAPWLALFGLLAVRRHRRWGRSRNKPSFRIRERGPASPAPRSHNPRRTSGTPAVALGRHERL